MTITKRYAKTALRLPTDAALARFLRTSRQALHRIDSDAPLPKAYQWQLRAKRPDLFPVPPDNPDAA